MAYSVIREPSTTTGTTLDDKGFVGSTDVIIYNISVTGDDVFKTSTLIRQELQNSGGLPREGSLHPDSGISTVRAVALNDQSPSYRRAVVSYTATPRPSSDTDEDQDPWELPASISFASVSQEVPVDTDADGNAILNPGTDEPVEGITRKINDLSMVITKNLVGINPTNIQGFSNKVNNDTFLDFVAGRCLTGDISANPAVHDGTDYYIVVVPVMVREPYAVPASKTWYHRRMLKGFYHLDTAGGDVVRAVDKEGQYTTTPVLLAANGTRLALGGTPIFEETKLYEETSFGAFGIL